jgi:hypothetical protein
MTMKALPPRASSALGRRVIAVRRIGSRSEVSSRHLGMVTMGRSVPNQIDVHAANAPNSLRRPDSQPAWLIASLRDGEYDEPSRQVCGFTSVRSVDNSPAWMTRKRPPRTESPEVEVPPVDILDVNAACRDCECGTQSVRSGQCTCPSCRNQLVTRARLWRPRER